MTKEPETIDCVTVKERAQRPLAKALAGKSPAEQAELLRRLAAQAPLGKSLAKAQPPKALGGHPKPAMCGDLKTGHR
jgi:hypothetical protein